MDIERLYLDNNIEVCPEGNKHHRHGWINTICPWCDGNPGYHLGYCIDKDSTYYLRFVCWRCGGKKTIATLAKLLRSTEGQVYKIIERYGLTRYVRSPSPRKQIVPILPTRLPPGSVPLHLIRGAVKYLESRGFDASKLEQEWGLQATGPGSIVSVLDRKIDYSYRIVIPVYYKGTIVNYQCRDWTGKSSKKYLACHPMNETWPLKKTLYGLEKVKDQKVILVEGVTDVWNTPGSVGCYGIKYRPEQIRLLMAFDEIDVMFDPDPQAKQQAAKIVRVLREYGKKVQLIYLPKGKDPAEAKPSDRRIVL